ncbi:MAG TPA: CarD family transcriptional regulator [Merdimonas faecis]|uniref:CarD family transcriptional regulator n=1 Tax=Merdimonas faecis TaxID=1653435 RepID=A0A9D2VZW4_9FIRM|nr:CarD family transcriptional regulator [Merdimonas faecis]
MCRQLKGGGMEINMPQINDYVNYSTHGICKIEDQH